MPRQFCPECGLVDLPDGVTICRTCGCTVLDPDDAANEAVIEEVVRLRSDLGTPGWMYVALGLLYLPIAFVLAWLTGSGASGVLALLVLAGAAWVMQRIVRMRLTQGWQDAMALKPSGRDRGYRRFLFTSATAIAFGLCVVAGALTPLVGIDALWYQRGAAPWRLVTASLAHGGFVHFAGNMLALYLFGVAIDLRVGRLRTAVVLAIAAVAGALLQARFSPAPMVGFSGAIYGLIGATIALMPARPAILMLLGIPVPLPMWAWSAIMIPLFTFTAWVDQRSHVAWAAHLGGLVAGFVVALPMRRVAPTPWFEHYEQRRARRLERLASD